MTERTRWLILTYRLPRVAAWRKPKTLGTAYSQDGVALLEDTVTHEQLQWLQRNVRKRRDEFHLVGGSSRYHGR